MAGPQNQFTPYSTLRGLSKANQVPSWIPDEERLRVDSYGKYEEIYWNDPTQFALRVLEGEAPIYIPNARTIVDTTSHYLLKGLTVTADEKDTTLNQALTAFLDRELFYSRFHVAKHKGVSIGDFVFHMTANPKKAAGSRISLNSVDAGSVFPIYDDDVPDKLIGCHIVDIFVKPIEEDPLQEEFIRKLTYRLVENGESRRVSREEAIWKMSPKWYGPEPEKVKDILPLGFLDDRITSIPVYWFKNIDWDGWPYGASEIKGFETILRGISQGSTDVQGALSLEGLGVYATDGGRPVDDQGVETDWEVSPGRVMEVPQGSYFRRVEGVSSITPMSDQFNYLESKLREAGGLSDVALGRIDVQTAQSGIALAIKFLPTLAKIDERDTAGVGKLKQLFFDWKIWHQVFEGKTLAGDVHVEIGEKLPEDRTAKINELNNMLDRRVISIQYYRDAMKKLGYEFPDNIQQQIDDEAKKAAEQAAAAAPAGLAPNAAAAAVGDKPPPDAGGVNQGSQTAKGLDAQGRKKNRSNNSRRPNESGGTEAAQTVASQARGGKSR